MSLGSISPSRCESASRASAALRAIRFLTRSVIVADGAIALTRTFCGAYTNTEIATKIDFTPDYIAAICYLLEHGEERLLAAVERGVMPANIAMEIARAADGDIQQALAEAYENKLLPGNQIPAIRRIILQRNQRRKSRGPAEAFRTPGS